MVEPEAPVGRMALRHRRIGRFPLIHRRQPAPEQDLAPDLQLLGGLVAGIDSPGALEPLELALVEVEPLRLPDHLVGIEPQPCEIVANRLVELGGRPLAVGVVDPEDEPPAVLPREQEVVQRRPDVPDVQPPGRRGSEAGDDGHRGVFTCGPVWKKLVIG